MAMPSRARDAVGIMPWMPFVMATLRDLWRGARRRMMPAGPSLRDSRMLHVYSKGGGVGDELIAACAIQAAVRRQPGLEIVYHARFQTLLDGLAGPRTVAPFDETYLRQNSKGLTYAHKHSLPIPKQMTAQLGVPDADDFSLDLPERPIRLPAGWPAGDNPRILVQVSASGYTPNKQWPLKHWQALIEELPEGFSVIEVGTVTAFSTPPRHPGWCSLAGQTSLEEFASCFRACSAFVGPVSGGMHLAHAFRVPSVIITGGYEAANFPYPLATQIGSGVECAPCWLRTPCPHERRCLREISPETVTKALFRHLGFERHVHG